MREGSSWTRVRRNGVFVVLMGLAVLLLMAFTSDSAEAESDQGVNAIFIQWAERSDVIHLFEFGDEGQDGHGPAVVPGGSPVYFGYEWGAESIEDFEAILANHDILVSIDGASDISLKHLYQTPFVAVPGEGPRWSWDHDHDGLGNNNGIAEDWDGPVMFWRYGVKHLEKGTHTFLFTIDYTDATPNLTDLITVEVG